jgi:hypothetical protein
MTIAALAMVATMAMAGARSSAMCASDSMAQSSVLWLELPLSAAARPHAALRWPSSNYAPRPIPPSAGHFAQPEIADHVERGVVGHA